MDKWVPITKEELVALIEEQLADCPPVLKEIFSKYQVPLEEHRISRYGKDEKVFVVAIKDSEAMYYEDVEDGFNFSPLDRDGTILKHGCDQDVLKYALLHWQQKSS